MSDVGGHEWAQEMARGLCHHLNQALDENTPSRAVDGAREVAQLLSLRGLDRLLGALAQYAHGPWPAPLRPVIERIRRGVTESTRAGHVDAFRRMDDELGLMARAIERVPLARLATPGMARPETQTVEGAAVWLADALEGVPGERGDSELLRRVRLSTPVAGALRAALDWLVGGSPARMQMWLSSDGSALDVTCEGIAHMGLQAAADVLTSVGAHLGPTGERPGSWTVRVPIRAERETFLMLEQEELQLAVPWHAVVRVRLVPSDTIELMLRRQGLPVLPPLAVATRRAAEQPVVVVALGLKRACLVADRLVWRMSADPVDAPAGPPAAGIVRAVRSDDGAEYWVLDPDWLLRGVAAPPLAHPGLRTPAAPRAPVAPPAGAMPEPGPVPIPISGTADVAGPAEPSAPLQALGPEHVEPLEGSAKGSMPAPEAEASTALATAPEAVAPIEPVDTTPATTPEAPAPREHAVRRALVAEDSIAARIFLVRLLEEQGFVVHAVASAAELREEITRGPWTMVCVDGELPDAGGREFLPGLAHDASAGGTQVVALVRDAADEAAAHAAGVTATLRKPYGREALERLLDRLVTDGPSRSDVGSGGASGALGGDPDPREWGAR